MTLGSLNAVSLVKAKEIASELHAKVRLGQGPAGQKAEDQQRATETFEAIATNYLTIRKRDVRPRSYDQVDRNLMKYCKPAHR
jgi:hypothetical protein